MQEQQEVKSDSVYLYHKETRELFSELVHQDSCSHTKGIYQHVFGTRDSDFLREHIRTCRPCYKEFETLLYQKEEILKHIPSPSSNKGYDTREVVKENIFSLFEDWKSAEQREKIKTLKTYLIDIFSVIKKPQTLLLLTLLSLLIIFAN